MENRLRNIALDANVVIDGLLSPKPNLPESTVGKARQLISNLQKEGCRLYVPIPVVTEILVPLPIEDYDLELQTLNINFRLLPYDLNAAKICATLIAQHKQKPDVKYYATQNQVSRERVKVDYQIIAIAMAGGADIIYSEDSAFRKFCEGYIDARPLPPMEGQFPLPL